MKDIKQLPLEDLYESYQTLGTVLLGEYQQLANDKAKLERNKKLKALGIEDSEDAEAILPTPTGNTPLDQTLIFDTRSKAKDMAVERFVKTHELNQAHNWFPFQLINYFGSWTPILGSDGLYDATATRVENAKDGYSIGAYLLATSSISPLFKLAPAGVRQYNSPINPLVPIILAGMKQNKNILYSQWSRDGIDALVYKPLAEAMLCQVPDISEAEIAVIKAAAITDMSGKRAGVMNSAETCTKLNKVNESALSGIPKLAQYMVLQTWCAHPSNRNKNAIVDPRDWDNVPAPLIKTEPLTKPTKAFSGLTPW